MKIIWTLPAVYDLESIRDYIARDSEFYATSFIEKIISSMEKLIDFPKIGRVIPEASNHNLRELIFQNYRIMYRIYHDTIQIIAIIRGSRDMTKWPLKPWEII
jgi:addiction module RelE/StbE family toxin